MQCLDVLNKCVEQVCTTSGTSSPPGMCIFEAEPGGLGWEDVEQATVVEVDHPAGQARGHVKFPAHFHVFFGQPKVVLAFANAFAAILSQMTPLPRSPRSAPRPILPSRAPRRRDKQSQLRSHVAHQQLTSRDASSACARPALLSRITHWRAVLPRLIPATTACRSCTLTQTCRYSPKPCTVSILALEFRGAEPDETVECGTMADHAHGSSSTMLRFRKARRQNSLALRFACPGVKRSYTRPCMQPRPFLHHLGMQLLLRRTSQGT
eukprot:362268-Chlamydomonas_euryale.AAC.2